MNRSKHGWLVLGALTAAVVFFGGPPALFAQDVKELERMDRERDAVFKKRLNEIQNNTSLTPEERTRQYDQTYSEWLRGKQQTAGIIGNIKQVENQIENTYRQPGFWDKVGDTALGIVGEMLKNAIKNWMNNPNEENRRKMEELAAERDRLLNERNNPNPGGDGGFGRPVYDGNGNVVGWDRDGDGRPDSTDTNGDGTPDNFNGGTNDDAYGDPYEYLEGTSPTNTTADGSSSDGSTGGGDFGGGGLSSGGGFNGSFGGGSGEGEEGGEGEGEGEDGEKKDEELAAGEDGEGTPTGKAGTHPKTEKDKNGDGVEDEKQMTMVTGRVIVLLKDDPNAPGANGAAGNRVPNGPVEDDWKDMEDNGDSADEWGEDWGNEWEEDPATTAEQPGPGQPGALPGAAPGAPGALPGGRMTPASEANKLVDQLIRVETVVAEWRKKAKEELEGKTDPYGFSDAKGYRGGGTTAASKDPLAAARGPDGKLDFTKVEVWIIDRDTWHEGKEPRRFQVTVAEDALDSFDPIHGGYAVVRGIITLADVDPRVLQEIRGEVSKLEVVQVMLSQQDPPEALAPGATVPGMTTPAPGVPSQPLPPLDEGDEDSGW